MPASLTRDQNGSNTGSASERPPNGLSATAVRVARLGLDHGGALRDHDLELLDREVGVGERRCRAAGTCGCRTTKPTSSCIQRLNARMLA